MTCDKVQEMLTSYLDNELTEDEHLQISIHLEQCPECNMLLQYIKEMQSTFIDIPEVEPPSRIRENVMKAISKEKAKEAKKTGWQWRRAIAAGVLFVASLATGLQPLIAMKMEADMAPYNLLVESSQGAENTKLAQDDGTKSTPPANNSIMYFTAQNSEPDQTSADQSNDNVTDQAEPEATPEGTRASDSESENTLKVESSDNTVAYIQEDDGEKAEQPRLYTTGSKVSVEDNNRSLVGGVYDKVLDLDEGTTVAEPKWYERIPRGRLLISFSGVVFSLIMLWYSRPNKVL